MARTIPATFAGVPTLTAEKVALITKGYISDLGNADKATEPNAAAFYIGGASAIESMLRLLYSPDVVEKVKVNRHITKKTLAVIGIVGLTVLAVRIEDQMVYNNWKARHPSGAKYRSGSEWRRNGGTAYNKEQE